MAAVVVYDENQLRSRLSRLNRQEKTAFAATTAERVLPLFSRYEIITGRQDAAALRAALDEVWRAAVGEDVDLVGVQEIAERLVPEEDEAWVPDTAYAQNAAAAVAYAVRTWLSNDATQAVWAARQAYEAADYFLRQMQSGPLVRDRDRDGRGEVGVVRKVVTDIHNDLAEIELHSSEPGHLASLRQQARRQGEGWAALIAAS